MRSARWRVAVAALSLVASATVAEAQYSFVGSWAVADGPVWTTPGLQAYTAREAAALLFGGVPTDYAISTAGPSAALINFSAFLDGYADTQYLTTPQSQDFKMQAGADYQAGPPTYSAYVYDHACAPGGPYCDPGGGESAINYAFRIQSVPEPSTYALLGSGLVGLVMVARRRARR